MPRQLKRSSKIALIIKQKILIKELKKVCPKGVDVYFDNVGGETLDIMTRNLAYEELFVDL